MLTSRLKKKDKVVPLRIKLLFMLGLWTLQPYAATIESENKVTSAVSSLLEEGAHCVAYRAERVLFFLSSAPVIGRNCEVSAQVLPEIGGLYHIEVNVPVQGFSSGDKERDHDVMRVLKAEERPELTFRTKAMTAEKWKELFRRQDFEIEGELTVGTKSYPLKMKSHYAEKTGAAEIDGSALVHFEDFGLKPPKVMAGVVAKAKSQLELHFRLQSQRILGADTIRLGANSNATKQGEL